MKRAQFEDRELLHTICDLMEIKSMKASLDHSVTSGLAVGALTTLGGLLFGPRGLAIGGFLGGLGASYMMEGSFKSVPDIIMHEATVQQQCVLINAIRKLLTAKNIMTMGLFISALSSGDTTLIKGLKEIVIQFLKNMGYST